MNLRIKLFQDGAELPKMVEARQLRLVDGFTTNPTLMRKAGVSDYRDFARKAIAAIPDLPISFEVFSDDFDTMEREAREIAYWGGDTYVKIPVTNTKGKSTAPLIRKLSAEGFSLQRYGHSHLGPSRGHRVSRGWRSTHHRFGVRGPGRGYRGRSCTDDEEGGRYVEDSAQS